ncbi:MAG: chitobiase/beta-hexosaminidase C-terminal domain-containing protein, partial [Prevotella sp.]|nr:chitobiase/beta-hexosaminidase C-terminal domain-containing protein [Prevotella sp.]
TLDAQGEAQLTIHGELLGTTALRCQMEDDEDATALVIVGVRDSLGIYVLAPIASRASGSEVYYGTKILLSSNTHGATIYYTLDGSCPCDDNNPAVKVYDNAKGIIIEADNVTIKAMAVAPDMDASDIETYTYTLRRNTATYDLKEGWNWVSHNQRTEMDANKLVSGQSYVVDGSNQRVSTIQPAQSYQAYSTEAKSMTLSGIAWNPMEQAITLQSGWNWLGFPMNQVMTPAEALQFAQAEEGDIIVGQDGFSEYIDGQWTGSLLTLMPGKGYAYISQSAKAFYLNGTIVSTAYLIDTNIKTHWPVNMHTYQNIMPVTAILTDGSAQLGEDYVIGAFNDDVTRCLGEAQWINGRFLLLVNGEQDATIRYLAYHKSSGRVYDLMETSRFRATCVGSRKSPLTLTLGGENTGITELPFNKRPNVLYDLQGRRVIGQPKHGIYIGNGKKVIY